MPSEQEFRQFELDVYECRHIPSEDCTPRTINVPLEECMMMAALIRFPDACDRAQFFSWYHNKWTPIWSGQELVEHVDALDPRAPSSLPKLWEILGRGLMPKVSLGSTEHQFLRLAPNTLALSPRIGADPAAPIFGLQPLQAPWSRTPFPFVTLGFIEGVEYEEMEPYAGGAEYDEDAEDEEEEEEEEEEEYEEKVAVWKRTGFVLAKRLDNGGLYVIADLGRDNRAALADSPVQWKTDDAPWISTYRAALFAVAEVPSRYPIPTLLKDWGDMLYRPKTFFPAEVVGVERAD